MLHRSEIEVIANRVQGRFVKKFKTEIETQLKNGKTLFKIDFDMGEPIGNIVERGKSGEIITSKVRVVIVKDNAIPQGWRIHTSFPIIREGVK